MASDSDVDLRAIFDNAAFGVAEIDAATDRFIRINRVFCELIGYSETELLKLGGLKEMTHPDDRAEQARQWDAIRSTGRSFQSERRFFKRDGAVIWLSIGATVATMTSSGRSPGTGRSSPRLCAVARLPAA